MLLGSIALELPRPMPSGLHRSGALFNILPPQVNSSSNQFAQVEGLQRRRWEIVGEDFGKADGTAGEALDHPAVGHDADWVGGGRIPGEDAKATLADCRHRLPRRLPVEDVVEKNSGPSPGNALQIHEECHASLPRSASR